MRMRLRPLTSSMKRMCGVAVAAQSVGSPVSRVNCRQAVAQGNRDNQECASICMFCNG